MFVVNFEIKSQLHEIILECYYQTGENSQFRIHKIAFEQGWMLEREI